MREFLQDAATLNWWLGVVVVGILINVVSHVLIRITPKILGKFQHTWAERNEKAREKERELVEWLVSDRQARLEYRIDALADFLRAIFCLVGGTTSLMAGVFISRADWDTAAVVTALLMGGFLTIAAVSYFNKGWFSHIRVRLVEARLALKEQKTQE
jgi:hypothetical protein